MKKKYDKLLLIAVIIIAIFGIVMIYSASSIWAEYKYDDPFKYVYPEQVDKSKIPKEALEYFDDIITHNDLDYEIEAPCLDLGTIDFQIGIGGGHAFIKDGIYQYDRGDCLKCV